MIENHSATVLEITPLPSWTYERERSMLQRAVALLALVPILAGLAGVVMGPEMIQDGPYSISSESHYRYLSGLLLGIGLVFWSTIPSIEESTRLFRFLTLIVFIGGLARLLGLFITGVPSFTMIGGLGMELVVTPLLCLWQAHVARRHIDRDLPIPAEPEEDAPGGL